MPLIQWNEGYSVKVATLDAQHQKLIAILNELHEAMAAAKGEKVLAGILSHLGEYARLHLDTEERLLKTHGFPGYLKHKAEHDAYIAKVRALQSGGGRNGVTATIDLLQFLKKWWTEHILGVDRQYSQFLNQKGVR